MNMNGIETIKKTIHLDYHLQRDGKYWKLNEQPTVKLRVPTPHSIGFSMDNQDRPPLAFLSNKPPRHIAKISDAILVLRYQQKVYWFIIEQKSAFKRGYEEQLINGKYFCDWLTALCKQYKYLVHDSIYISLLVWRPREKLVDKDTTSHHKKMPFKASKTIDPFSHSFEVQNKSEIFLIDIIRNL